MTGRPDDGYRVAARIESRASRRGRFLAVVFGLVVVAWGAVVLGNGRAGLGHQATGSGRVAEASGPRDSRAPAFPPDVTILDPRAPTGKLPVRLAGLELLDPRVGTVEAVAPVNWLQFPFATAAGASVCVCVEPGTGGDSTLHGMEFLDNGDLMTDVIVPRWLPLGEASAIAVEAAQVPGTAAFVVASAIELGGEWTVRLDWLDVATGDRASRIVDAMDGATWSASDVGLSLAIAPDGRQLRLWLGAEPSGQPATAPPSAPRIWTVPIAARGFGQPAPRVEPWTQDVFGFCSEAAWASPTTFVTLCQADTGDGSGEVRTVLRIDAGAGRFTEADIARGPPEDAAGWLVDGSRGIVYGWFGVSHELVRIDVATATVAHRYPGDGRTNLLGIPPDGSPPPARTTPAIWQPFQAVPSSVVGSPDGSIVYAVGLTPRTDSAGGSAYESTGIWAFNADSLAIVGHWAPAADYIALGISADGGTLIGLGPPRGEEVAQFGNHGPLVVFHDARDGSVLSVIRGLTLRAGGDPFLLAPALPGGFGG